MILPKCFESGLDYAMQSTAQVESYFSVVRTTKCSREVNNFTRSTDRTPGRGFCSP